MADHVMNLSPYFEPSFLVPSYEVTVETNDSSRLYYYNPFIDFHSVPATALSSVVRSSQLTGTAVSPDCDDVLRISTANLTPQKGIEHFIRAAAIIHGSLPNTHYTHFLIKCYYYDTHRKYMAHIQFDAKQSGIPQEQIIGKFQGKEAYL